MRNDDVFQLVKYVSRDRPNSTHATVGSVESWKRNAYLTSALFRESSLPVISFLLQGQPEHETRRKFDRLRFHEMVPKAVNVLAAVHHKRGIYFQAPQPLSFQSILRCL
jgi:hypothetical protein